MKRSIAMLPTLLIISAILATSSTAISNNKINTSNKQTGNNNNILLSRHHRTAEEKDKRLLSINRSNHRLFQSGKLSRTSELEAEVDVQVDKVSPQYTNPILDSRTHKERNKGQSDNSSGSSKESKESEDTLLNVNVNVNVHNNGQDDSQVNERYNNGEGGSSVDDGQDWFDYDRQDTSSSSSSDSSDSSDSSGDSSDSSEDSSSESSSSESTSQDEVVDASWIGVQHNTATLSSTSSTSSSDDIDECIKSGGTWSLNSWNRKLVSNPNHHQQLQGQQQGQQEQGQRMTKTQKAGKHSKTWGKPPTSSSTDYFEWNNGWWYESNGWWYPANWGTNWRSGKSGKSGYYSKSSKSKSSKGWKCVHPPSTPSTDKPTSGEVPTKPSDKPTFAEIIETDRPTEEETDKPTVAPITPIPTEIVVSYKVDLAHWAHLFVCALLPFLTYDICLICTCLYPSSQNR